MSSTAAAGASQRIRLQSQGFSGAIDEHRTQALAAAEHCVALRRMQALRYQIRGRQRGVEDGLHARLIAAQPRLHRIRAQERISRLWILRE
jgi:hypothetical protein